MKIESLKMNSGNQMGLHLGAVQQTDKLNDLFMFVRAPWQVYDLLRR